MNKELFLKGMEELLEVAKGNNNQIDKKEILDYFEEYQLNEQAQGLLLDSFVEAGVHVIGYDYKKEEEQVEQELGVIAFYEEELAARENLTHHDKMALFQRFIDGEVQGNQIIEAMLPIVVDQAKVHQGKGVLFGDLIQEGNIGLIEAVGNFREGSSEELFQQMNDAVTDAMLHAIASQKGADTVGEQVAMKANRLDDASSYLAKELKREPTAKEIADYLSIEEKEVKDLMKISLDAISVVNADITEKK